ncbi:MAG: hypothetical protein AABW81_04015 [Nanoarchaeota archaeon]
MNYQETDKLKLYLRKNLLENYLTEEEKEKLRRNFPFAKRYILTSEEISKIERDYMKYEEKIFTSISNREILIKTDEREIIILIEEPKGVFNLELKEYIKQQKISLRLNQQETNDELIRLENANKIAEEII